MVPFSHGWPVLLVADTTPKVDDLLSAVIHAAGTPQLAASREVLLKCVAHCLKAAIGVSFYGP
jgi:hypothetical protein